MKKIMDAAFRLIAKKGYESASIAEIAAAAGVSKGLVYSYFESKQDLVEKIVANAVTEADAGMETLVTDDPAITFENIIRRLFKELKERPEYFRLMFELTFKIDQFEFVREMAAEKYKFYSGFVEDLFRRMHFPDPAGEAKMVSALFDGIGIQYVVIKGAYPIDDLEEFLVNKYCRKNTSP